MMTRRPATREPQLWTGKQESSDGPSSTQQCFPSLICVLSHICGGSGGSGPNWSGIYIDPLDLLRYSRPDKFQIVGLTLLLLALSVGCERYILFLPLKWAELC